MRAQAARDARGLRITARREVATRLSGAYRSAYRGHGLVFEELREYTDGEDASRIEWNATARLGRPIVKQMREERDLLLALLVDVSPSLRVGFADEPKVDAVRRAAAALASAAAQVQDRVALATFADGLLDTVPPAAGSAQLERVFRALEGATSRSRRTNAEPALRWANETLSRHSIVVLLSDLLFPDPGPALATCARKHDLLALRVQDPTDAPPRRGAPARVRDAESGRTSTWRRVRSRRRGRVAEPLGADHFQRLGARQRVLHTGGELIPELRQVFRRTGGRR